MPIFRGRFVAAGVVLSLSTAHRGLAQDLPPLPDEYRSAPAMGDRAAAVPPPMIPRPPVIFVPPEGVHPTWNGPGVNDPVAEARHKPGFVVKKSRSWIWRRFQGKMLGYPEQFGPRPLGSAMHDHGRTMVANGAAARLVLFNYDFVQGTAQLSPRGREQLVKVAAQLSASPYPLLIERTQEAPALAEARRLVVLRELAAGSFPIDPNRVLVGLPSPHGLSGVEAHIITANQLNRTQQYGPPIPLDSNGLNSASGVTNTITGTLPDQ